MKWTESQYERGSLTGTSRWTAILTIQQRPPRSADVLRKNPLGIYVDAIDWSRELDAPAAAAPARTAPSEPAPPREVPAFGPAPGAPQASIPQGSPLAPAARARPANEPTSPERNAQ